MRIISGTYKGRRITAPKKLPVRPTTDMAKEGLFNILSNRFYFKEISVLDLFAGTGNISYEFASRGVEKITAVDVDHHCVKFMIQTSEEFKMPIQVIKRDVFQYLNQVKEKQNIIFADPPYHITEEQFKQISELVFTNELLKDEGFLIIEHSKHTDLSGAAHFDFSRHYGGSVFSFFK